MAIALKKTERVQPGQVLKQANNVSVYALSTELENASRASVTEETAALSRPGHRDPRLLL